MLLLCTPLPLPLQTTSQHLFRHTHTIIKLLLAQNFPNFSPTQPTTLRLSSDCRNFAWFVFKNFDKLAPNVQKRVCSACAFQLSFHFAHHRWWLGRKSFCLEGGQNFFHRGKWRLPKLLYEIYGKLRTRMPTTANFFRGGGGGGPIHFHHISLRNTKTKKSKVEMKFLLVPSPHHHHQDKKNNIFRQK